MTTTPLEAMTPNRRSRKKTGRVIGVSPTASEGEEALRARRRETFANPVAQQYPAVADAFIAETDMSAREIADLMERILKKPPLFADGAGRKAWWRTVKRFDHFGK
jgi:uncharacterized iron-regulated protein